jgi:aldose 1-epimerase
MSGVTREPYGVTSHGDEVSRFILTNRLGARVCVLDWGATISELHVPDRAGRLADVVLGFDTLAEYEINLPYFGGTIGRVANRIAGGRFELDGVEYRLYANDGPNHLHGGARGFDKHPWQAETLPHEDGPAVRFEHVSPDGDEGYPGRLEVRVTMVFDDEDRLTIAYEARADAATPVNLTNHSYFNLAGGGDILGHLLELHADRFAEVDAELIPTGRLRPVANGAFDFNAAKPIGLDIAELEGGYDHNFVLDRAVCEGGAPAAVLVDPVSGRRMTMHTDEPGVQLYTGHLLDGVRGKHGAVHHRHAALCLEAQHFPDALHQPAFPSVVLRPGETYRQRTSYRFDVLHGSDPGGPAPPAR